MEVVGGYQVNGLSLAQLRQWRCAENEWRSAMERERVHCKTAPDRPQTGPGQAPDRVLKVFAGAEWPVSCRALWRLLLAAGSWQLAQTGVCQLASL